MRLCNRCLCRPTREVCITPDPDLPCSAGSHGDNGRSRSRHGGALLDSLRFTGKYHSTNALESQNTERTLPAYEVSIMYLLEAVMTK